MRIGLGARHHQALEIQRLPSRRSAPAPHVSEPAASAPRRRDRTAAARAPPAALAGHRAVVRLASAGTSRIPVCTHHAACLDCLPGALQRNWRWPPPATRHDPRLWGARLYGGAHVAARQASDNRIAARAWWPRPSAGPAAGARICQRRQRLRCGGGDGGHAERGRAL